MTRSSCKLPVVRLRRQLYDTRSPAPGDYQDFAVPWNTEKFLPTTLYLRASCRGQLRSIPHLSPYTSKYRTCGKADLRVVCSCSNLSECGKRPSAARMTASGIPSSARLTRADLPRLLQQLRARPDDAEAVMLLGALIEVEQLDARDVVLCLADQRRCCCSCGRHLARASCRGRRTVLQRCSGTPACRSGRRSSGPPRRAHFCRCGSVFQCCQHV